MHVVRAYAILKSSVERVYLSILTLLHSELNGDNQNIKCPLLQDMSADLCLSRSHVH